MSDVGTISVQVDADTAKAITEVIAASKIMEKAFKDIDLSFGDVWDKQKSDKESKEAGEDTNNSFNKGWEKANKKNSNKRRSALKRELLKWGGIVGIFGETIGVALYGAAGAIVALGSSLISAISASAALIPIGVGLGAAFGAVAVGLEGVGSALGAVNEGFAEFIADGETSAETLEKIEKALKNLAPNAAEFVKEFANLLPIFREIRVETQGALFEGLAGELANFSTELPRIGDLFVEFASSANSAFRALLARLQEIDIVGIFERLVPAIDNVLAALAPLVAAFFGFVDAATPAATLLSEQFLAWATSLDEFVNSTEGFDAIQGFLDTALTSLQSWMDLIGALGGLLGTTLGIASESGDNLVNSLTNIINKLDDWLNTDEGRDAFLAFLETSERIVRALEPVLVGLGDAFAVLVTDSTVSRFEDLAESVGELLPLLAEVLTVIGDLGLLNTLADLLVAVGEALPMEQLSTFAETIGGFLQTALDALIDSGALEMIGELLGILADSLTLVFNTLEESGALEGLGETIALLAEAMGVLLVALEPLIIVLAEGLATQLLLLVDLMVPLLDLIIELTPLWEVLGQAMADLATLAIEPLNIGIGLMVTALNLLGDALSTTVDDGWAAFQFALEGVQEAWNAVWGDISNWWPEYLQPLLDDLREFTDFFEDLWDALFQAAKDLYQVFFGQFVEDMTRYFNNAKRVISGAVEAVAGYFRNWNQNMENLKVNIQEKLNSIRQFFIDSYNDVKDWVLDVVGEFTSLPGKIGDALSGVGEAIAAPFRNAAAPVQNAVNRIKKIAEGIGDLIGKLNPFAKGGIVAGPTAALIGEAGAEAVIPLTRPLSQVDPSVRGMAALIRGENQGGYAATAAAAGSVSNSTTTNNWTINDSTGNAEITAQKVLNRMSASMR